MRITGARAAAGALTGVAALALLTASLLAGCGANPATSAASASGGPSPSTPARPAVIRIGLRYAGGAVAGGVGRQAVPLGSTVELVVSSDVADEVHLHGYDKKVDVPAGGTATLSFVADMPGVFEVELESRSVPLTRLEVR